MPPSKAAAAGRITAPEAMYYLAIGPALRGYKNHSLYAAYQDPYRRIKSIKRKKRNRSGETSKKEERERSKRAPLNESWEKLMQSNFITMVVLLLDSSFSFCTGHDGQSDYVYASLHLLVIPSYRCGKQDISRISFLGNRQKIVGLRGNVQAEFSRSLMSIWAVASGDANEKLLRIVHR